MTIRFCAKLKKVRSTKILLSKFVCLYFLSRLRSYAPLIFWVQKQIVIFWFLLYSKKVSYLAIHFFELKIYFIVGNWC